MVLSRSSWQHHLVSMRRNMESTSSGAGQVPAVSPQCPSPCLFTASQVSRWGICPHGREFLSLPPGAAASLDTAPSLSNAVRTLSLLCSWRSTGRAGVVLPLQLPAFTIKGVSVSQLDKHRLCPPLPWDNQMFQLLFGHDPFKLFLCGSETMQPVDLLLLLLYLVTELLQQHTPPVRKGTISCPSLSRAQVLCISALTQRPVSSHGTSSWVKARSSRSSECSGLCPVVHMCWACRHGSLGSSCLLHQLLCKLLDIWAPPVSCTHWIAERTSLIPRQLAV